MKKHWYLRIVYYCPECGATKETRERVYGKKPKDPHKLYQWITDWDYCNMGLEHWL